VPPLIYPKPYKTMKRFFQLLAWIGLGYLGSSFGCSSSAEFSGRVDSSTGTGGSMARFTVMGNNLYVVDQTSLRTFDISEPSTPRPTTAVRVGMGIETIFPFRNHLFIGSNAAMFIYNLDDPNEPRQLSMLPHATGQGCDPVVAQGNYAYVTLRASTQSCGGRVTTENVMFVIDIRDFRRPQTMRTYSMTGPYGVGVRGPALFLCEGASGLRVFDATDPVNLVQKSFLTNVKSFDVIPLPASVLVVGEDGLYQFDYQDLANLKQLSKIPVAQ
jgi:hypothetical protein